jgi:hypothetical protein
MSLLALFLLLTVGLQLGAPLLLRAFLDAVTARQINNTALTQLPWFSLACFAGINLV